MVIGGADWQTGDEEVPAGQVQQRGAPAKLMSRLGEIRTWVWCNVAALVCGPIPVVLALTRHDHGSVSDPECIRRCYTLVHVVGGGVLLFVGAPLVIALVVLGLLYLKRTRQSRAADLAAWWLASLSSLVCVLGLFISVGMEMLPVGALTMAAVATSPVRHPQTNW